MPIKDILIRWLNDAYAMETGIIEVLEEHIKEAEDYPKVKERIVEHLEETKNHQRLVQEEIERLGGDISEAKSIFADFAGSMQGKMTMGDDKLVKNAILEYATEHKEIAVYNSIIVAAERADEDATVEVAESILKDEEEMAEWLHENLPTAVEDCIVALEAKE